MYGSAFSSSTNCVRFCFSSTARGCEASTFGITGCCGCSFHQMSQHLSLQNFFTLPPSRTLMIS